MRSSIRRRTVPASPIRWLRLLTRPWVVLTLFLLALLGLTLPSLRATDSPAWAPRGAPPENAAVKDLELGLRARAAIHQDPVLAGLDVGVTVRDRVATLWGTVPTRDLAQAAEEHLQQVLGGIEIKNELHCEDSEDDMAGRSSRSIAAGDHSLVKRLPDQHLEPHEVLWHPAERRPAMTEQAQANNGTGAAVSPEWKAKPPATMEAPPALAKDLSGPRPAPILNLSARATPTAREVQHTLTDATPGPNADLAKRVEALRGNDQRLSRVQTEVRGGVVYLRGQAANWEQLYDLARSVARLPGVERVVLQDVHADVE